MLLCQVFLTDGMPDLCPVPVLSNYSHHRPARRRDTCTLWEQGGSSAGIWLCHRCPLEQQVLGWPELVGQRLTCILWQNPGEDGLEDFAS